MGNSAHFMLSKLVINTGDTGILSDWCGFHGIMALKAKFKPLGGNSKNIMIRIFMNTIRQLVS